MLNIQTEAGQMLANYARSRCIEKLHRGHLRSNYRAALAELDSKASEIAKKTDNAEEIVSGYIRFAESKRQYV